MRKNNANSGIPNSFRLSLLVAAALTCIIAASLLGCAGETRGTGGGTIGGRVLEVDGVTAIPDVVVTNAESGESSVTDANGNFSLPLQEGGEVVSLQFREPEGAVSTGSVPVSGATSDVSVVVVINRETSQAQITLEAPTPTPTPTTAPIGPTARASPTPTNLPGPSVTATPVPPTVTPTVTPAPQRCPSDFNNDGVVNQDDFDQFTALFHLGDPGADYDGNGFVNGDDYDAFLDAYAFGC